MVPPRSHQRHAVLALVGGLLLVLATSSLGACRRGVASLDTAPNPTRLDGTVTGTVRGFQGLNAIEGRAVAVVNIDTGERHQDTTSSTGGFAFKCKPGKYRVEVTLRAGESFLKRPGVIDTSDADAHADFVVGAGRTSRPRQPAGPGGSFLGPPIA